MARRFREFFKFGLPARFRTGEGELVQGTIAMLIDASLQRVREAVDASLPSKAGDSALVLHGLDRGIRRGRSETREHYAQRLIRWRWPRGHRVRGGDWGLLEQISEYFGGMYGATVDARGNVYSRDVDGAFDWAFATSWNWDGVPPSPQWARFWVALDPSGLNGTPGTAMGATPALGDPSLWGGGYGVAGQSLGLTGVTPDDAAAIRALMKPPFPWKMAGCRGEWVMINVTGGFAFPDGTWGRWSKDDGAGTYIAARYSGWRYWSLSPETNNVYSGDPTRFCNSATFPDGSDGYNGSASRFPGATRLPDGTMYTGNPNSFPNKVRLVDDGSQP